MKPGTHGSEAGFPNASPEQIGALSPELVAQVRQAAKDAELLVSCARLEEALALVPERADLAFGTFERDVASLFQCFRRNGPCDTAGKALWERFERQDEAFARSNVPIEFILQCVRVGAARELYHQVQQGADHALDLTHQLRPDKPSTMRSTADPFSGMDNGLHWANARLQDLAERKRAHAERVKSDAGLEARAEKTRLIEQLGREMQDPAYVMSEALEAKIGVDLGHALAWWKGTLEYGLGRAPDLKVFFERSEKSIPMTRETFIRFMEALRGADGGEVYQQLCESREDGKEPPMLQVLNPESGWSYPARVNGWNTYSEFVSRCCSNANNWWADELKKKRRKKT